jgi:hypothetical protein
MADGPGKVENRSAVVDWPHPFMPIERPESRSAFEAELCRELKPGHPLFGLPVSAAGARYDQDDILFELLDAAARSPKFI